MQIEDRPKLPTLSLGDPALRFIGCGRDPSDRTWARKPSFNAGASDSGSHRSPLAERDADILSKKPVHAGPAIPEFEPELS